uniref:ATP-dependent Clp protease ATP-binding subunit clpX n=1 Tax=Panagrellus redivivus TaxID=6233 RepID=A0A7E4ZQM0_PANRE
MRAPFVLVSRLPLASGLRHHQNRGFAAAALAPLRSEVTEDVGSGSGQYSPVASSQKCGSCGKPLKPVQTVNSSNRYLHCTDCNSLFVTSSGSANFNKWNALKSNETMVKRPPYPREIAEYLEKYVVGQNAAKKSLSVGIYQHYRRLANNAENNAQNYLSQGQAHPHHGNAMNFPQAQAQAAVGHLDYGHDPQFSKPVRIEQPPHTQAPMFRAIPEKETSVRLDKSNILLVGPSGVGKTYVTQVLARILDVPIALSDCTSMTQAGYVGEDVENCCAKLLQNAQNNVERAQQGIVFLDEIDKIAAAGDSHGHAYRDVSGEGVQHALLKLVEGTVVNVKSGRKGPGQQDTVPMDTTDVLFVASGAFTGLERIVGQRLDKRAVGFGASTAIHSVTKDDSDQALINQKRDKLFSQADQGDLIKFGIVPELVGRFPVLVPFHSFDKSMLVRVLSEPANSLLAQMKYQFAMDGVDLDFDPEALEEIAHLALERKTGARALRSIVEKVLLLPKFEVPGSDIASVQVTRGAVQGTESCSYRRREQTAEQEAPEPVAIGAS